MGSSEEVMDVGMRRNQPLKMLGQEHSGGGAASAKVLWHVEQGIRELTKDQGPGWEGDLMRLGALQGPGCSGFHKGGERPGEAWGGWEAGDALGLCGLRSVGRVGGEGAAAEAPTHHGCGQPASIWGPEGRSGGRRGSQTHSGKAILLSPGAGLAGGRKDMECLLLTNTNLRNLTNPSTILAARAHVCPWAQQGPGNCM